MPLDLQSLEKNLFDFARPQGSDLLQRCGTFHDWVNGRRRHKTWPYMRSLDGTPGPDAAIIYESGETGRGINFASQDYLSLSNSPRIVHAAQEAIRAYGVHSAGSAALLGNTRPSLKLEQRLAGVFRREHAVLYPTGWGAGYGCITALVRSYDHIVMDKLSHACLQAGAAAATRNIVATAHLDIPAMIEAIRTIRRDSVDSGILVVTESLFSMDSDTPDLGPLQDACREFGATLLVDVAHDFGALGPEGTGHIGLQDMLGKVDLVMGAFSKTFASNGGFVVCENPAVRDQLRAYGGPHTFSNALSPVQASVVHEALDVVSSEDGAQRREKLMANVQALRACFARHGIDCLGAPSAIVPVPVGTEAVARVASMLLFEQGVLANLVEFPAVRVGSARFRMQVMADHRLEDMAPAADIVVACLAEAKVLVRKQFPALVEDN